MTADTKGLVLKEKILAAAVEGAAGDLAQTFTIEDLVVWAWLRDKKAWGLRGYEDKFPDTDKLPKDMRSRGNDQKSVIDLGWIEKVEPYVFRLTSAGLATYAALEQSDPVLQEKAGRELQTDIAKILEHPVFKDWLMNAEQPRRFRDAGFFWGIAPGTPVETVRERIRRNDTTLEAARTLLDQKGVDVIAEKRGKKLFERADIERCMEFHKVLKKRFASDLQILDPLFREP